MVDLGTQYQRIKSEVDLGIQEVIDSCQFIKGEKVRSFEKNMVEYLNCLDVVGCGNGTDALQISLMALGTEPGDEIILPAHTYMATAEVVALLRLTPVLADVDPHTFNIDPEEIRKKITNKTKVIMPVHLYGQSANMESILAIANEHGLKIIEDNAQAIGGDYTFSDGRKMKTGTMGDIGTTSFYPSKNLGCYGDGGAIFTNDASLAERIRMIANHGQKKTYYHDLVGVNSRLDAIQAAVLDVKLRHLDTYNENRRAAADYYDSAFADAPELETPFKDGSSTHVFHQYTLKVPMGTRDDLKAFLKEKGIPSMIYYPLPMYRQKAFSYLNLDPADYPVTEDLYQRVISLPIHSEIGEEELGYVSAIVKEYYT
ncbi:MAG: DegT/DnrJ/EryC1/StrS family aminotransferase [Bacteroidetes bacterium]|nr:DegT/DnrJ/EryC1/StrS family aminotransferase [Bacteroidota bacterium]